MRATWLLVTAIGACSGSSKPAEVVDHRGKGGEPTRVRAQVQPPLPPIGSIDEGAPVPACPAETDLAARLRERWQVPQDARIDVVACTRGRFGKPGWLVDAFIDFSDDESEERIEVLASDDSGIIAALEANSALPDSYRHDTGAGNGWEVVDLDADGVDEMLLFQDWNHTGVLSTTLEVYRIDGQAIREVGSLRLAFDNKNQKAITAARLVKCQAQHAISDGPDRTRHIMVEGTITTSGRRAGKTIEGYCPLPGSHRYGLVGGALVEVKP
jgi:hypothetical protein